MKTFRILHITDFHIDSPELIDENFRLANYKPFIKKMAKAIQAEINDPIDYIITTGDYINKGKIKNFSHCNIVLKFLAKSLKVDVNKLFTCIGNHDFDSILDKTDPKGARKPYHKNFASDFGQVQVLYKEDIFQILFDKSHKVYFLIFDSTFGSNGVNSPSKLSIKEKDRIYLKIEETIPSESVLFILSHYPMDVPKKTIFIVEEKNWTEKHFWKDSFDILHKLNLLRDNSLTIYFFGDGHSPDFWSYSIFQHAFLTGMIGGKHEPYFDDENDKAKKYYNKITQFKLIETDKEGKCFIRTFQFVNDGFEFSTNSGSWQVNTSQPRYLDYPIIKPEKEEPLTIETVNERKFNDQVTEPISTSIENEIIEEIEKSRLYCFGHHKTSETYSSLGWVDIDSLMNNRNIFCRCVEKAKDWIFKEVDHDISEKNSVFIGLDYWGACISAHVSVLTSITNYCIATKSKGRYNIEEEKLERVLKNKRNSWKYIFLFSDVVSTGYSINHVAELIQKKLTTKNIKIISISIISDIEQKRAVNMANFFKISTFCSKLRIPVIENSNLPNNNILPARLDIS
ncbi:hypothetical protein D4R20_02675 [bacterium]|nr:MAG: hypothetical protein D4R20_02675 [bacterium]